MSPEKMAEMQPQRQQPRVNNNMSNEGFIKRTGKQAIGEKMLEASMVLGSLFLLGAWANMPDSASKVAAAGLAVSSFSLAVIGITSWLNIMPPPNEKSWKGYMIVSTLLIYLASNGLSLSHITSGITKGAKVVAGSAYEAGAGVVSESVSGTTTVKQSGSVAFSDTDKGAYAGTVPCQSLDWSKAGNANVQNGSSGAREWCTAGADALAGNVSTKFAKACGCK